MINAAVSHLVVQLNQFLKQAYALTEDVALMSGLVDAEGHAAPNTNNKLVVFVTNLEKDTVPYRQQGSGTAGAMRSVVSSAPLYLNLYVMIAANLISGAIAYFQRFPVFDHQVTPGLDPRIKKLVLDIENLKTHELSNVWALLGGKYLPSVLYKVRMIAFDTDDIVARVSNVHLPAATTNL
jgi:hypothetical protein